MEPRSATLRDRLVRWQRNEAARPVLHWSLTVMHLALMICAVWTWRQGWYGLTALVWAGATIVAHNKLIAFHESAHGMLQPVRWANELAGHVIGCAILVPLTAYRIAHAQHHAHLGTVRDVEFWPFVDPAVPRWRRVLAVVGELLLSYVYHPLLFARAVCVARHVAAGQRRRAAIEYAACALFWGLLAALLTWKGWWVEFCVAYLVPAWCAAGLNALRRMIEHLGMLGDTVETTTRTISPAGPIGRVISAAVLHVDHHGTHHRHSRVPYYHLPQATRVVYADEHEAGPVFASYWSALRDMLPHMLNPRIGVQWRAAALPAPAPDAAAGAAQ